VSVRDAASLTRAKTLCPTKEIVQSSDPILLLLQKENQEKHPQNVFIIIPRHNSPFTFVDQAEEWFDRGSYSSVVILSLQPDDPGEREAVTALRGRFPEAVVVGVHRLEELVSALSVSSFVFSARYHGALIAKAMGIPFAVFAQAEGDKLSALAEEDIDAMRERAGAGERALREALSRIG
jgi:polysaccharide pyruvyl transferase WcaK-like protein